MFCGQFQEFTSDMKIYGRNFDKRLIGFVVAAVFVVGGSYALKFGSAAQPSVKIEPENGTTSAPALVVNDVSASNGKSVRFKPADPPPSTFVPMRTLDLEQGGSWFDGVNGQVTADTTRAYKGTRSAKVIAAGEAINRGWIFADKTDYCKGVLAPIGSERWIGLAVYVDDPLVHKTTRIVATSFNPSGCGWNNGGSIIALNLHQGKLRLEAYEYQSGNNMTLLSPSTNFPAKKWLYVQIGFKVSRDSTGWGELVVDGVSQGRISGQTMKTAQGDYNSIQFGAGWSWPGTPSTPLWLDDIYLAGTRRE